MIESDLVAALHPVTDALDALDVRYYLGGSLASSAHGVARASLDVDLIAELEGEHLDRFARRLESAYYVPIVHMRAARRVHVDDERLAVIGRALTRRQVEPVRARRRG